MFNLNNYTFKLSFFFALTLTINIANAQKEHPKWEDEPRIIEQEPVPVVPKTRGTTFIKDIRQLGPYDAVGRITCLLIDRTNSNHLIAGAETGGLWESYDRGKSWSPIDDHLPTLSIQSITQDPFNPSIIYASSYERIIASGTTYRPDILRSTDGGKTFQLLPATSGTFTNVRKVVVSPAAPNTIYALSGFGSTKGLYRSTDAGQSFTNVFTPSSNLLRDIEVMPDGTVLVTVTNELYRSPNGNSGTFTQVTGFNGGHTFSYMDVGYCESQPNIVYGLATGGNINVGMFKSSDGGLNWNFLKSFNMGMFTTTVGVKPDDPNIVFGGSVGMEASADGGNSFHYYTAGGVDYWSVNFDPNDPSSVFITLDHGIIEYELSPFQSDPYATLKQRDSLLNSGQIYQGDFWKTGDRVVIGMQDNGSRLTGDYENSVGGADGGYCYFHRQDSTIIYFSQQNGRIMKKDKAYIRFPDPNYTQPFRIMNQMDADNNGTIDDGANFIHPFWVNGADGEQLYYPTKKKLWRSTDGGDNWQPISATYTGSFGMDIVGNDKPNPTVYWTVGSDLYIMPNAKTAAVGSEFKITMPSFARTVTLDPNNDSIMYFIRGSSSGAARVFRSSNLFKGNVQWQDITGDLPNLLFATCIDVNPYNENQLILGTESGLYVSDDGGQHWEKELQFPNAIVSRVKVRRSDNRIFIYSYGRGAWAATFPGGVGVEDITRNNHQLTIWPNPGEDVVHVGVKKITTNTSVQVFSLDGKLLKKLTNLQHTPVSVHIGDLPKGYYIIATYEKDEMTSKGKILKQ